MSYNLGHPYPAGGEDDPNLAPSKEPRTQVALVFDDGYKNNFTVASRILAKYGFSATLAMEIDKAHQNLAGDDEIPFCSASDMRELISLGWEIANHPALTLSDTEDQMMASLQAEDQLFKDVLSGAKVWNGSSYDVATPSHPQYSTYSITSGIYRFGNRNATSDLAFRNCFDKIRVVNGSIANFGDVVYTTDSLGEFSTDWTALSIDTSLGSERLTEGIAFLRSLNTMNATGIVYAHATPEAGSIPAGYASEGVPYITDEDLETFCAAADSLGVKIVPLNQLGNANLVNDPRFTNTDNYNLIAASGDSATWNTVTTLHNAPRSAELTATAYQGNINSTSVSTHAFSVQPFCRYKVRVRYKIETELVLNGGSGNINHGIALQLETIQGNTAGSSGGTSDDFAVMRNAGGYNRPYQVTSGWGEMVAELHTGYGYMAQLSVGLFQCTGTVLIGHVSMEKRESFTRFPLSGNANFNTTAATYVYLMNPPPAPNSRGWRWKISARANPKIWTNGVDTAVDYAYENSADISSPADGQTVYVLGEGAGDFLGEGGKIGTYDSGGGTWSFATVAAGTFIQAADAEGEVNYYYYVHGTLASGLADVERRRKSPVLPDHPIIHELTSSTFGIYNRSGTRSDAFQWFAEPMMNG